MGEASSFKLITLFACMCFGVVWVYLSVDSGTMYIPPRDLSDAMILLISGKLWHSYAAKKEG